MIIATARRGDKGKVDKIKQSPCHSKCSTDSVVRLHKDIILSAVSFEPPALSAITHWVALELFKSPKAQSFKSMQINPEKLGIHSKIKEV